MELKLIKKIIICNIPVGYCDISHLTIHIVFSFYQFSSVHFTSFCFARYNVAFSLMQNFHWNTNRHFKYIIDANNMRYKK